MVNLLQQNDNRLRFGRQKVKILGTFTVAVQEKASVAANNIDTPLK